MEQSPNRLEENPGVVGGLTRFEWKHFWQKELEAEKKRNREWRKCANEIVKRYLDHRRDDGPQYPIGGAEFRVNLFHSNIFTITSFLYGRVPTVDVSRRFADANDDEARVAANILERILNTSIEFDGGDFSTVLRADLEDHLVPGLAQARVRYEFASQTIEHEEVKDENGQTLVEAYSEEQLLWEDAPIDYVHWRDFRWGYGRTWKDIPWVGYNIYLTKTEAEKRFGEEIAKLLDYRSYAVVDDQTDLENPDLKDPNRKACIVEIWDKETQHVFWYHEGLDYVADIQPDPLRLPGFFSCPRPMTANPSTTLYQPTPYFTIAQDLYNEVDQLSTRINIITNAVKVVGVYAKDVGELKNMLQNSIENDLVPVDNWAMLAEKGGLKGTIDFFPVRDIAETLDKLRQMRVETIDLLYQVTGLSDIMRGHSQQYAGVGQEQIKAKFGSVRIQYLQDEFARFASELLEIRAQVICRHFEPRSILEQSNILRSYDVQYIEPALGLLKNPDQAIWRVEVKPESMAMVDWGQLQLERTEFLNALAVFLQSSAPIIQLEPSATPILLELLKWGLAGFKGGQEIESVIDAAIQQFGQGGQQGQEKQNPELQKSQAKMMENQQKFQQDLAKQADKAEKEMQKLILQFRTKLAEIQAGTAADIAKEVAQADEAIREERAKARLQTKVPK